MRNKSDIINEWLTMADHDLAVAKLTRDHLPEYYEIIAFHCQQAVEKYFKAFLIFLDIEPIKTHDLLYLYEMISRKKDWPLDINKLGQLQEYSVEIRYPNVLVQVSESELDNAISIVQEVRNIIQLEIK
jgi:HEPN domain-containing protein